MNTTTNTTDINYDLLNFTEHLVSISDFSRGKTGKIFDDVSKNNTEYIVLKNNQPTAVVVSVASYKALIDRVTSMERLLDKIEENRLQKLAEQRMNDSDNFIDHKDICAEFGFTPEEIRANCESVEIE